MPGQDIDAVISSVASAYIRINACLLKISVLRPQEGSAYRRALIRFKRGNETVNVHQLHQRIQSNDETSKDQEFLWFSQLILSLKEEPSPAPLFPCIYSGLPIM
jgi:hypothetical protein